MDLKKLAEWEAALETAAGADEVDLEPVWDELTAAVEAEPDAPELRRLRVRMAEATFMHASRHEDLLALRRLDPADRQARLDLALLQHRWAFLLVPDGEDDDLDAENDPAGDEESGLELSLTVRSAEPPTGSPQELLQQEALGWLAQLLREHQADAAFCAHVFARWEQANIYAPWLRLTLSLEAVAAHPADAALARVLALAWAELANQVPVEFDPENAPLPMGFLVDVGGTLWDPFMQERALAALADLLQRDAGDTELLVRRARLLEARCDFASAARAYAEAADAAKRAAEIGNDAQAEDLYAEMRDQAALCAGGRRALANALVEGLADAVSRFGEPLALPEDASEARREFAADWELSMRQHADELQASVDAMRATQPVDGPDAAQQAQMQAMAQQVAASVVGSISFTPLQPLAIAPAAFERDWEAVLREPREALAALQWSDLGWVEWPAYRALFGSQTVSSVWCAPCRTLLALVSGAGGKPLVDLESELDDGHMLITSLTRGRNFLTGGPDVDTLFIEPALVLSEAIELHAARLKLAMAGRPGVRALPITDLDAMGAAQERARACKTRFRLEHGLTESESLGVPSDFAEVFAPMARTAVRQALEALRARR
ncbi:hypothetical protein FN976_15760 [Caenimonas sedimenti]|uniref:Uncharacterized protein n=1 Tax=Caenimonas sedimenti TaxID=2596921 RepID=A0A562ZPB7_9BURK|nr:hypothetical protein [Caenimonas sedimenti]TWO70432.1 hypothetical protein FN976_15760 [Caenimonas sedimenti]